MKEQNKDKAVYIVEGLHCAHCAARIEQLIRQIPGVVQADLTFATKQLTVMTDGTAQPVEEIRRICTTIEEGVTVRIKKDKKREDHEREEIIENQKKEFIHVCSGTIAFVCGIISSFLFPDRCIHNVIFIAAYLILGTKIVWAALKNLVKGQVFDENFLMSVATIGALAIGDYAEAAGVMLFYRIGELFEEAAVNRSRAQIMEAVDLRPETVQLSCEEGIREISAWDVCPGDIVVIRPGDRIPLDGVIAEGTSQIDTSPVTGEPVPVQVTAGVEVFSGCVNLQGVLKMKVLKPLEDSMVTRILNSVENAAASKPKIDRFITKFARIYTPVVVAAALVTAILPSVLTGEWRYWIYTAITFLVISCPCALVLSIPLAFFSGIGAGSRRGILFKGGLAIEALKNIKAVVMDKTGTLTRGEFEVQNIVTVGRLTKKQILGLAADCEAGSSHPIAVSIERAARKEGLKLVHPASVEEISGKGIKAEFPEGVILCGSRAFLISEGIDVKQYTEELCGTEVLVAAAGRLEGYLIISDTIKPEASGAIKRMKKRGLITVMLTGDVQESAQNIAGKAGIDEVHAQLLPQDKLYHLKEIRKKYGAVMFVGDGINDAPVLAGADVGAAMGSGADAAIEAADVVFMTSSVDAIPEAVEIADKTGRIAMQNVIFALAAKFLIMILGLLGYANMWMAVFADTGVAMICILNSVRILYSGNSLQKY